MAHTCSRHRDQQLQRGHKRNHQSDSRCQHKDHHRGGYHESLTRNHHSGNQEKRDAQRSSLHRSHSVRSGVRHERKQDNHRHHSSQGHRNHDSSHCRYRPRQETSSTDETSTDETSSHISTDSDRFRKSDGRNQGRSGRSSKRNSKRAQQNQMSDFTPLNYGTPGCRGCQQQQAWAQGCVLPAGGPQQPPPQGGWYQGPPQQQSQYQQQPQNKPPPPELEELRKNVFKGIKEFSKSLRKQQWLGEMDYIRSSRKVKHGHKPETMEEHRKGSRRRDWERVF